MKKIKTQSLYAYLKKKKNLCGRVDFDYVLPNMHLWMCSTY